MSHRAALRRVNEKLLVCMKLKGSHRDLRLHSSHTVGDWKVKSVWLVWSVLSRKKMQHTCMSKTWCPGNILLKTKLKASLVLVLGSHQMFVLVVHRPEGVLYQMFRNQFLTYCLYQSKKIELGLSSMLQDAIHTVYNNRPVWITRQMWASVKLNMKKSVVWGKEHTAHYDRSLGQRWSHGCTCVFVCVFCPLFCLQSRLCPVPPVLLPEWLFVQTQSAGRKT